ncbi:TIGR00269 family protein [Candidatus Parvarchaeota archaeon]|nr:TIGR00269 family protein [Candidatus Parvarchaeota archaeon]
MQNKSPCAKCAQHAAVALCTSGTHLCKKHFLESVEKRFKGTVREHKMLKRGDHVAIGLSGGKDSVVMMHLLFMLSKSLPLKLTAITVDEGIAGYRSHTLKVAASQAKKLKIPLIVTSFKKEFGFTQDSAVGVLPKSLPCSHCGVFRRSILNRASKKAKAALLAIGHNLDDMAQTYLMNIMRNDLGKILRFGNASNEEQADFVPRIKPLMELPEREIALYAMLKGLPIHFQECPYANKAFRQHVRNMLNDFEDKYPGTKVRIFKAMHGIAAALNSKNGKISIAEGTLKNCKKCGEPTSSRQELCSACKMASAIKQCM